VEGWAYASAEALYPDGTAADTITILAPPAASKLVHRLWSRAAWLQPGDQKAVTLSEGILEKYQPLAGADHPLKINGQEITGSWWVFKFVTQQGQ